MPIRVKSVCVIRRGHDILLSFAVDPSTGERYARLLGGGIETGERAADAARREMREELGVDVETERLLGVVENLFEIDGVVRHEIIFVFAARFRDPVLYERELFPVDEDVCDGPARWVPIAALCGAGMPIYPPELKALLVS